MTVLTNQKMCYRLQVPTSSIVATIVNVYITESTNENMLQNTSTDLYIQISSDVATVLNDDITVSTNQNLSYRILTCIYSTEVMWLPQGDCDRVRPL